MYILFKIIDKNLKLLFKFLKKYIYFIKKIHFYKYKNKYRRSNLRKKRTLFDDIIFIILGPYEQNKISLPIN